MKCFDESWREFLKNEFAQDYFVELAKFLHTEYEKKTIFPEKRAVFRAFLTNLNDVKVVILGQDPYHTPGVADGLAFSVKSGGKYMAPSLLNIYKEIESDLGIPVKTSGDLTRWEEQGVLLLNTTLTVRAHMANSHQGLGWGAFTDAAIKALSDEREHLVFMLWGSFARSKKALIDTHKHFVLESVHPSPLSANRGGWFGQHQFSRCNQYLKEHAIEPIKW